MDNNSMRRSLHHTGFSTFATNVEGHLSTVNRSSLSTYFAWAYYHSIGYSEQRKPEELEIM